MTGKIFVGDVQVGGGAAVSVQSMCNTDTRDVDSTVRQIKQLEEAGCRIVRVAVPDLEAAQAISEIKRRTRAPLVADIHFDYRLAVEAVRAGADKIRINPGNIGSEENVRAVADACRQRGVPIRVGVNRGSLVQARQQGGGAATLCRAAVWNVEILENCGFEDICVSLKASNVFETIEAYRLFSRERDYPLHLGVTEAGGLHMATLKSAAAFGALLCDGIGDTLRVSVTGDPVLEVAAGLDILKALGLNTAGVTVISCPTCGRTEVDLIPIARQVEDRLKNVKAKLSVAVMGCAVNGPGEASDADVGVACGDGEGLIICKGKVLYKVPEEQIVEALVSEVRKITGESV